MLYAHIKGGQDSDGVKVWVGSMVWADITSQTLRRIYSIRNM